MNEKKTQREQILGTEILVDKRPFFKLVKIDYKDAYGAEHDYFAIDRPGAVAIAAITKQNEIILVKQFRPPIGKYVLSLPAGLIDKDKDILTIAKDELLEEAGFTAKKWQLVGQTYNSTGILNEEVFLFLATGLKYAGAKNNILEGEHIEVIKMPFSEKAVTMALELAQDNGCEVESSLIAYIAMVIAKESL